MSTINVSQMLLCPMQFLSPDPPGPGVPSPAPGRSVGGAGVGDRAHKPLNVLVWFVLLKDPGECVLHSSEETQQPEERVSFRPVVGCSLLLQSPWKQELYHKQGLCAHRSPDTWDCLTQTCSLALCLHVLLICSATEVKILGEKSVSILATMSQGAIVVAIINPCKATKLERHEALSHLLPPLVPLWLCGVSQAGAAGPSSTVQERTLRSGSHGTFLVV